MVLKKIPGVTNVEINKNGETAIESEREVPEDEIESALAKADKTVAF
jgi:copper chaperone CopZ